MFREIIAQTPFTTEATDACFENIRGGAFANDTTFLATLRALLAPRMGENDSIDLTFGSSDYTASAIRGASDEAVVGAICGRYRLYDNGQFIIHSFKSNQEGIEANFKVIGKKFASVYEGYHRQGKLKDFYRKSFNLDCYINPELKSTIVFVENLDVKKMHYLQVSILAMLPWYLDPKVGVTEEEMELIYSMRETTPDKYNLCLAKMAEKYDFRSARIRQMLSGFETKYEQMECDRVKREIESFDDQIRGLNRSIGDLLRRRNDDCILLLGLETKIAEGCESEIMEYFLCNRNLVLERVRDCSMSFSVKGYLEYFDSDMAGRIIQNRGSLVYSYGLASRGAAGAEKAERLLTEIFVRDDPRLKIRFCAAYQFNMNGTVSAIQEHRFGPELDGYMPNTHIDDYGCMGGYKQEINTMLLEHNYIAALEQCVASCKSLNWGDSIVMDRFMYRFWDARCIELPDGRVVTAEQAIQWLEEQDSPAEGAKADEGTEREEA